MRTTATPDVGGVIRVQREVGTGKPKASVSFAPVRFEPRT